MPLCLADSFGGFKADMYILRLGTELICWFENSHFTLDPESKFLYVILNGLKLAVIFCSLFF